MNNSDHFYQATPLRLVPCEWKSTQKGWSTVRLSGWTRDVKVPDTSLIEAIKVERVKKTGGGFRYILKPAVVDDN